MHALHRGAVWISANPTTYTGVCVSMCAAIRQPDDDDRAAARARELGQRMDGIRIAVAAKEHKGTSKEEEEWAGACIKRGDACTVNNPASKRNESGGQNAKVLLKRPFNGKKPFLEEGGGVPTIITSTITGGRGSPTAVSLLAPGSWCTRCCCTRRSPTSSQPPQSRRP